MCQGDCTCIGVCELVGRLFLSDCVCVCVYISVQVRVAAPSYVCVCVCARVCSSQGGRVELCVSVGHPVPMSGQTQV